MRERVPIIVDCTELYQNPVRSGIQRVVREMLRYWPEGGPEIEMAWFNGNDLCRIPDEAHAILADRAPGIADLPPQEVRARLRGLRATRWALPSDAPVFIPEMFYDRDRAFFHRNRAARAPLAMLAFDFLPFLQPDLFNIRKGGDQMGYLVALRAASSVAHISEQTRQNYINRLMRHTNPAPGPVLQLGADGLMMDQQQWSSTRKTFVALGSLDGRKNQHLILEAFTGLWRGGRDIPLVIIGNPLPHINREPYLTALKEYPRQFKWLQDATDAQIRAELADARATIYASTAEGYGLPPVESLCIGIPTIANAQIPSLEMIAPDGQWRLSKVTAQDIREAVVAITDDMTAAQLWAAAAQLKLQTWRRFGEQTAAWIAEFAR